MSNKPAHVVALDKAKIALMQRKNSAFYTSLCLSMRHRWNENIPTAQTNGVQIEYCPDFFMSLSPSQRLFVLVHETQHVAYDHMGRLGNRNHDIANEAADHVINLQCKAAGFDVPDWTYCDERFVNMSFEQVYNILFQEHQAAGLPQPGQGQPGQGPNGNGSSTGRIVMRDLLPLPKDKDPVIHAQEIKEILVRAVLRSKQEGDQPGSIPGDIKIMLDELLYPKLPWQTILKRFLQAFSKNDYSWRRPNRRYFPEFHLPSLHSEKLMDLTVAVDTSASVSDQDFAVMVSEIASVFRNCLPNEMTLIQFDTQIKSIDKIRSLRDLQRCKFTGRGGTSIVPVLEWANLNKPQLLMTFTDGDFRWPLDTYPSNKTLWIIHDNLTYEAPFGRTINYEMPHRP